MSPTQKREGASTSLSATELISVAYAKGFSVKQISKTTGHSERHCERVIEVHYLAADLTIHVNEYRTKM